MGECRLEEPLSNEHAVDLRKLRLLYNKTPLRSRWTLVLFCRPWCFHIVTEAGHCWEVCVLFRSRSSLWGRGPSCSFTMHVNLFPSTFTDYLLPTVAIFRCLAHGWTCVWDSGCLWCCPIALLAGFVAYIHVGVACRKCSDSG